MRKGSEQAILSRGNLRCRVVQSLFAGTNLGPEKSTLNQDKKTKDLEYMNAIACGIEPYHLLPPNKT